MGCTCSVTAFLLYVLILYFDTDVVLYWCVLYLLYFQYSGVESHRTFSQDSDSDDDVPDELKQDFIDEQTGEAPQLKK